MCIMFEHHSAFQRAAARHPTIRPKLEITKVISRGRRAALNLPDDQTRVEKTLQVLFGIEEQ
jgi:hypothetical protein